MVLPLGDVEKTRIIPFATYVLMAINIAVYLIQVDRGDEFTISLAATPYEITRGVDLDGSVDSTEGETMLGRIPELPQARLGFPVWLTLFTSLFLHGSPLHLAGNMLYLWIFGDNVEEILGVFWYLVTYLACGIAGTLLQIAARPDSLIPTLGASGAIAGVMAIYVVWFPRNRIRVLVFQFLTEMPALVVIGFWIASQIFLGLNSVGHVGIRGGVAYLAHVGGAATGFAASLIFRQRMLAFRAQEYDQAWFAGIDQPDPNESN